VLFASNQTLLDLRGEQVEFAISSQLICSLDDVACLGNQSECASVVDAVLLNTVALGVSVRVNDNRFQEGFTNTTYSLFSLGYLNTAATNQATHCLFVIGYRTEEPSNIVATDLFGRKCPRPLQLLKREYEIQDKTEAEVNKAPATS
jgi:hypothetical protein